MFVGESFQAYSCFQDLDLPLCKVFRIAILEFGHLDFKILEFEYFHL